MIKTNQNTEMKITKTAKTKSGKLITMTGELVLEKSVWLDGQESTVPCCEAVYDVSVEGHGSQGSWVRERAGLPEGYTHMVGQLALTAEQVKLFDEIKAEIEATPEMTAKAALIAKNEKELEEYDRVTAEVERAMRA